VADAAIPIAPAATMATAEPAIHRGSAVRDRLDDDR